MSRKRKYSEPKQIVVKERAEEVVKKEIQKDKNISKEFKTALAVKSRFVPLIKINNGAKTDHSIIKIEGNDYVEFTGLKGVYFNKSLFV